MNASCSPIPSHLHLHVHLLHLSFVISLSFHDSPSSLFFILRSYFVFRLSSFLEVLECPLHQVCSLLFQDGTVEDMCE